MEGYEIPSKPFYKDPHSSVSLYRAISLNRGRVPVIIKRYDFAPIQHKSTQQSLSLVLNSALAQAKVCHPHVCEIVEIQVEIKGNHCTVFEVVEQWEKSLKEEIEERMGEKHPYSEVELKTVLGQTSSALASAHSKAEAT